MACANPPLVIRENLCNVISLEELVGGAVVPLIIGGIAELTGLKLAMMIMFITLGYILLYRVIGEADHQQFSNKELE